MSGNKRVRLQVHATNAASFAQAFMPRIYKEVEARLTGYGLNVFNKQVQASGVYGVEPFDLVSAEELCYRVPSLEVTQRPVDPDLVDHPRFRTTTEIRNRMLQSGTRDYQSFKVLPLHTVTDRECSPHFVVLHDKVPGRECYLGHACTCGSEVRTGVPCRHFWAVLRSTSLATFQMDSVNELWFKVAQPFTTRSTTVYTFDTPNMPTMLVPFRRRVTTRTEGSEDAVEDEDEEELSQLLSTKRLWGMLTGMAKKAIEASISTGKQDALCAVLASFAAPGTGATGLADCASDGGLTLSLTADYNVRANVSKPDVVKSKGRPKATTKVGAPGKDKARKREPLRPSPCLAPSQVPDPITVAAKDDHPALTQAYLMGPVAPITGGTTANHLEQGPAKKPRATRTCATCSQEGHDSRTCPVKHQRVEAAT
jgi:hypothetical protein